MPLKLLIYCDDHGTGGAAQATHRLALGLAGRDFEVLYAQSRFPSPRQAEREAAGIRSLTIPYDTLLQMEFGIRDSRIPARMFFEHKPDLVLFSDVLVESTLGAKEAAHALEIPYLTVKHLVRGESLYSHNPQIREQVRRAIADGAGVIAVSENNRAILAGHFPAEAGRMSVIRNSVPERFFAPPSAENRRAFRARLGVPEEAVVVLTAAALVKRKGFVYQAQVIRALQAAGTLDRFVFVWAGDGEAGFAEPLWRELEAAGCTGAIRRIGFQADVPACLDGSDIVLLPSEEEGLPLVVLEAMAKGVPVIASAVGGTPEALAGGGGALIVNPREDPVRAAVEMLRLLTLWAADPAERARTGAAGRRSAEADFAPRVMLDHYEAALRRAAIRPGDYVSPGFRLIKPDWHFPCVTSLPDLAGGHNQYYDVRYSRMPMLSRDEVLLIHNTARQFAGRRALEIGGWLGWASWHLLAGGVELDMAEPLLAHPEIREAVTSWTAACPRKPRFLMGHSPEILDQVPPGTGPFWSLFLIDAERPAPGPLADVAACERRAMPDALILLAHLDKPAMAEALRWLKGRGWQTRLYHTAHRLAAAWRGEARPVDHIPDPKAAPPLPAHLADLA